MVLSFTFCFYMWMAMLGGLYTDGFLDLAAIENETERLPLFNFCCVCLLPPIAFSLLLDDFVISKLRDKNGIKK